MHERANARTHAHTHARTARTHARTHAHTQARTNARTHAKHAKNTHRHQYGNLVRATPFKKADANWRTAETKQPQDQHQHHNKAQLVCSNCKSCRKSIVLLSPCIIPNSCNGHQQAVGTWVRMWAACVELLEGWHTFITSYSSSLPMLTEPWANKSPSNIKLLSQHAAVRSCMCRPRRGATDYAEKEL